LTNKAIFNKKQNYSVKLPPAATAPKMNGYWSAFEQMVLQNSKVEGLEIFRENMKREAITDSHSLNCVTGIACELNVRRRGLSHLCTKAAPAARGNHGANLAISPYRSALLRTVIL
jgi:hypothetical protein